MQVFATLQGASSSLELIFFRIRQMCDLMKPDFTSATVQNRPKKQRHPLIQSIKLKRTSILMNFFRVEAPIALLSGVKGSFPTRTIDRYSDRCDVLPSSRHFQPLVAVYFLPWLQRSLNTLQYQHLCIAWSHWGAFVNGIQLVASEGSDLGIIEYFVERIVLQMGNSQTSTALIIFFNSLLKKAKCRRVGIIRAWVHFQSLSDGHSCGAMKNAKRLRVMTWRIFWVEKGEKEMFLT